MTDNTADIRRWMHVFLQLLLHHLLTVSGHIGVFTLLYRGLVVQTDLNFAAVRSVIHEDLRAHTRNAVNIQPLHVSTQLHRSERWWTHMTTFTLVGGYYSY